MQNRANRKHTQKMKRRREISVWNGQHSAHTVELDVFESVRHTDATRQRKNFSYEKWRKRHEKSHNFPHRIEMLHTVPALLYSTLSLSVVVVVVVWEQSNRFLFSFSFSSISLPKQWNVSLYIFGFRLIRIIILHIIFYGITFASICSATHNSHHAIRTIRL